MTSDFKYILCIKIRANKETGKENQTEINKINVLLLLQMNWWVQHKCNPYKGITKTLCEFEKSNFKRKFSKTHRKFCADMILSFNSTTRESFPHCEDCILCINLSKRYPDDELNIIFRCLYERVLEDQHLKMADLSLILYLVFNPCLVNPVCTIANVSDFIRIHHVSPDHI